MALFCPALYELELYDQGSHSDVVLTPTCTVVDSVLGLKWLWQASTSTASQGPGATSDRGAGQALLEGEWATDAS